MTDPSPLTDEELARMRSSDPRVADRGRLLATVDAERARADRAEKSKAALVAKVKRLEDRLAVAKGALPAGDVREGWAAAVDRADQAETERDALRAERDAARADRVCWRETHNQVAAERDALRAIVRHTVTYWLPETGAPARDPRFPHGWTDVDWADSGWTDAESAAFRAALVDPVSGTPGEHADGEGVAEFVMRGTPGEDTAPAEPVPPHIQAALDSDEFKRQEREADERWESGDRSTISASEFREKVAPAEPVCPTCNGSGPDCRPVGDLPGDAGNQP